MIGDCCPKPENDKVRSHRFHAQFCTMPLLDWINKSWCSWSNLITNLVLPTQRHLNWIFFFTNQLNEWRNNLTKKKKRNVRTSFKKLPHHKSDIFFLDILITSSDFVPSGLAKVSVTNQNLHAISLVMQTKSYSSSLFGPVLSTTAF